MKYNIIMYFCLLLCSETLCRNLRILGGTDADIREFSYAVSFRDFDDSIPYLTTHFCAGAVVSDLRIITAANCLYSYDDRYDKIRIYSTEPSDNNNNVTSYEIEHVIFHPDYIQFMMGLYLEDGDICVVKTVDPIIFTPYINKIDLPTVEVVEGTMGRVSGWGSVTYPSESYPERLIVVTMMAIDHRRYLFDYPIPLHEGQFCAIGQRGGGTTHGDVGSPFVYNNTLYGVASYTGPFPTGEPDVFSNVYHYMEFITWAMSL